jgi:hypothetical protein
MADLAVDEHQGIGRPELRPVRLGESEEGEQVLL